MFWGGFDSATGAEACDLPHGSVSGLVCAPQSHAEKFSTQVHELREPVMSQAHAAPAHCPVDRKRFRNAGADNWNDNWW